MTDRMASRFVALLGPRRRDPDAAGGNRGKSGRAADQDLGLDGQALASRIDPPFDAPVAPEAGVADPAGGAGPEASSTPRTDTHEAAGDGRVGLAWPEADLARAGGSQPDAPATGSAAGPDAADEEEADDRPWWLPVPAAAEAPTPAIDFAPAVDLAPALAADLAPAADLTPAADLAPAGFEPEEEVPTLPDPEPDFGDGSALASWIAAAAAPEAGFEPDPDPSVDDDPGDSAEPAAALAEAPAASHDPRPASPSAAATSAPGGPVATDPPAGWVDPLTSLEGPAFWDRVLASEMARSGRYQRPLTVVLVELDLLAELSEVFGDELATDALRAAAECLRASSRTSDYVARLGPGRFGVILTETDEIAAINFVERVRDRGPGSLPADAQQLRFAFGWASPSKGETRDAVMTRATKRLAAELAV